MVIVVVVMMAHLVKWCLEGWGLDSRGGLSGSVFYWSFEKRIHLLKPNVQSVGRLGEVGLVAIAGGWVLWGEVCIEDQVQVVVIIPVDK